MSTPRTNYILIDFENVQPTDLGLLKGVPFKVKVFLGPSQTKIPVALAMELQVLGKDAEYIPLLNSGRNALDFCIAYHIGVLSATEPDAFYHIISKDADYDPLLLYLNKMGIAADRVSSIADIGFLKHKSPAKTPKPEPVQAQSATAPSAADVLRYIKADLTKRAPALPKTPTALKNVLKVVFNRHQISDRVNLDSAFNLLVTHKIVSQANDKLSYHLN